MSTSPYLRARGLLAALRRDRSGMSIIEFAASLPVLVLMAFGGIEIANMAVIHMKVNQIAVTLADNASRMKQETVSGAPILREADVNQAFHAAELQGEGIKLMDHGRVILSSLEMNSKGGQWIHWQRCQGKQKTYVSDYGGQGTGANSTTFAGVGPPDNRVAAEKDSAIMVAEVVYDYQPLIASRLFPRFTMRKYSAMYVRDDRDLTKDGISNPDPKVADKDLSKC